jgi:hypothetical protein
MDYVSRQFINLTKKFRKELRKYQDGLHRDLVRVADGLKNLKETIDAQWQSRKKENEVEPRITVTDFQAKVPIRVKTEPKRSRIESIWHVLKAALEAIGILAVIAYTWVAYHQWQETIDATNFSARQTEVSRKGLNETIKNFRVDERAWIEAMPDTPHFVLGRQITVGGKLENRGKTPALRVEGEYAASVVRTSEVPDFQAKRPIIHSEDRIIFQGRTPASMDFRAWQGIDPHFKPIIMTRSLLADLQAGKSEILLWGKVTYDDIFGKRHKYKFCYVRPLIIKMGEDPLYRACSEYNYVD